MSKQVLQYISGTVRISFPENEACCQWCPLLNNERIGDWYRCFCKRTGEFIPAPLDMIGSRCPIEFEGDDNGEIQAFDGG